MFSCNADALAHFMLFPLFPLFVILTQIHSLFMRAHFNQFSSSLYFHALFVSPSNFLCAQFMAKKCFTIKCFGIVYTPLNSFSPSFYLSRSFLTIRSPSRNVLNVRSVRLNYFAFVCSGRECTRGRGEEKGAEVARDTLSLARLNSKLYYFVYRCFDDKRVS